jgi:hypothetical protein
MSIAEIVATIGRWPLAVNLRESTWLFPTVETVHVIAITLVVGSIAMLDLRLVGLASRQRPVQGLAAETLRWTWGAFGLAVLSGSMLFLSAAQTYVENREFRLKMLLLLLAGANMAIFHGTSWRSVSRWGERWPPPLAARVAGALSLVLWVGVVACGRWIGFTRL